MREEKEPSEVLKRLAKLINKEIIRRNCTIKAFAELNGVSYEEMRLIVNGIAKDIRVSTMCKICKTADISLYNLFVDENKDITGDMLNTLQILHKGTMYSISAKAYK